MSYLNGTWFNPINEIAPLLLIIALTIIIEAVFVTYYGIFQKFSKKGSIMLIIIVILANFISGFVGYILRGIF